MSPTKAEHHYTSKNPPPCVPEWGEGPSRLSESLEDGVRSKYSSPSASPPTTVSQSTRPKSTKALVNRFESLSIPPAAATTPATAPRRLHRAPSLKQLPALPPSAVSPLHAKAQTAIRMSWRNLVGAMKRDKDNSSQAEASWSKPPDSRCSSLALAGTGSTDSTFTAPLLVRSEGGFRWISCIATLRGHTLQLSPPMDSMFTNRTISLNGCDEVRSLTTSDLDIHQQDAALEGGENTSIKVFELVFNDRPSERFATDSVKARAAWVSSIRDAVLHEPQSSEPSTLDGDFAMTKPTLALSELEYAFTPHCDNAMIPPDVRSTGQPAILTDHPPPTPAKDLYHPLATPIRNAREAVSGLSSSRKRPSVAALLKKSSVRDRVGRINHISSTNICPASPSPRNHSRQFPRSARPQYKSTLDNHEHVREDSGPTTEASDTDSLLDAYQSCSASGKSTQTTSLYQPQPYLRELALSTEVEDRLEDIQADITWIANETQHATERSTRSDEQATQNRELLAQEMQTFRSEIHSALKEIRTSMRGMEAKLLEASQQPQPQPQLQSRSDPDPALEEIRLLLHELVNRGKEGVSNDVLTAELIQIARNVGETRRAVSSNMERVVDVVSAGREEGAKRADRVFGLLGEVMRAVGEPKVAPPARHDEEIKKQLNIITSLMQTSGEALKTNSEQQTENGRYLAEMCTWLDAFLKYSTSKQEHTSVTLEQLLVWLQSTVAPGFSTKTTTSDAACGLAISMPTDGAMFNSMNQMLVSIRTTLGTDAQARDAMYRALLQQLPDRQKREQAHMLRGLAAELSAEIKGERIRFVDAMKEATSVNVEQHVEQFKAHLGREVNVMMQEVIRLQAEKDRLEQSVKQLRRLK